MTSTVHGLGQLIALIPYEFGFVPHESVVVLLMRGKELAGLARFDAAPELSAAVIVDGLAPRARRVGTTGFVVVAFDTSDAGLLRRCEEALATMARVEHGLSVREGTWTVRHCKRGCCREMAGVSHEVPAPWEVPALADHVGRGVAPFSDRDAAMSQYQREVAGAVEAVERLAADLEPTTGAAVSAWCAIAGRNSTERVDGGAPEEARGHLRDVAMALAGLRRPTTRDAITGTVVPELLALTEDKPASGGPVITVDPSGALVASSAWIPVPWRATWLALLALGYWRDGRGHLAQLAVHAARDLEVQAPLVDLAFHLITCGLTYDAAVSAMAQGRAS